MGFFFVDIHRFKKDRVIRDSIFKVFLSLNKNEIKRAILFLYIR